MTRSIDQEKSGTMIINNMPLHGLGRTMTEEEFFAFCIDNPTWRIELDAQKNIIAMPPVGFESGFEESEIGRVLGNWNASNGRPGRTFSSSTGFILPNGAIRSPDACWVSNEKIATLSLAERKRFARIVPAFVVEIRSYTDSLQKLKEKMEEWIENGVRLAWLIDAEEEKSYIYRADGSIEIITGFDKTLSGEEVLSGFEFELALLKM